MKILIAMSGGVDSSVVAHLLKKQGHDLVGVQFKLWSDPLAPSLAQVLPSKCCNEATLGRARKVAQDLSIPLHHIDLSDEFKREVVDPFLEGHRKGLTPNPCIGCNKRIKFGKLLEYAEELSCTALATGHYARIAEEESSGRKLLLEAIDAAKDQSYFLYGLNQKQLERIVFPLGHMLKQEVFSLARTFGVPLPDRYQESQDLCFFPEKTPHAFLDRYLSASPGEIIDTSGKKHGTHRGLPHYTEGQRHGLRIGGLKIPLHVVSKNTETNTLTVGRRDEAFRSALTAHTLNWIAHEPERNLEHHFHARIHSLGRRQQGTMIHNGKKLQFRFQEPQLGISPGQSIVLYRKEEIVGGGVIY